MSDGSSAQTRRRTRMSRTEIVGNTAQGEDIRDVILDALTTSAKSYESQAVADPFSTSYAVTGEFQVEEPPYNLKALSALTDRSNMLRQCIDAYVANIESMGHTLEFIGEEGQEDSPEAIAELQRIESLLEQPNGEYDLLELRERNRRDHETIGAYAIEVIRDANNRIVAFYNLPVHTVRLTVRDKESTVVREVVQREGREVVIQRKRRFRRFVQQHHQKNVYFKEFGDPRSIDPDSGRVDEGLALEDQATEILYIPCYKPGYSYGVPRYIHQLPSILGSREAELTNLDYFQGNAIPALAVLVSGGAVTAQTIEEIEQYFTEARGRKAQNRLLIMEATGDDQAASEDGKIIPPKMELKTLSNERQNDAVFKEYDEANQKKIRSAFRLNPMFVGLSDDMTYATARASIQMTESQVFGPERNKVDKVFNLKLLADEQGRPPKFWRMKSNAPKLVNPQDLIDALDVFEQTGALSPNKAIQIANEVFGTDFPLIEEPWGNLPFSVTKELMKTHIIKGFEGLGTVPEPVVVTAPTDPNADPGPANNGDPNADPNEPANGNEPQPVAAAATKTNGVRQRSRGVRQRPRG